MGATLMLPLPYNIILKLHMARCSILYPESLGNRQFQPEEDLRYQEFIIGTGKNRENLQKYINSNKKTGLHITDKSPLVTFTRTQIVNCATCSRCSVIFGSGHGGNCSSQYFL
jgi:hypothetical protein